MTTDTSERGLETLIMRHMTGTDGLAPMDEGVAAETPEALADDNAEIGRIPVEGGAHKREPELDRLSNILKAFNDHFGTLFTDADRVARRIRDDIAPKVAADPAYQNGLHHHSR